MSLLLVGALYVIGNVVLEVFVDAGYVERKVNERLAQSTDGRYQVGIEGVDWSLWNRGFEAEGVVLEPAPDSLFRAGTHRYHVQASGVDLRGIHLWSLLWHGEYGAEATHLQAPVVRIEPVPERRAQSPKVDREAQGEESPTEEDSISSRKVRLASRLPSVTVDQFVIRDGVVSLHRAPDRPSPADSLWGVSVRADGIALDSVSARDTSRVLFSEHVRMGFDGYRHVSADSLYATTIGPLRASSEDSSLIADTLTVGPTISDTALMQRLGHRTNRFLTSAQRIELRGVDFRRFVEDRAIFVRAAHLDSLRVDVYRNEHFPPPPEDPPPRMPHEIFRELRRPVRIDTIRVENGFARYTKLAEEGEEPGGISFERIFATIQNVTDDPQRMTAASPAVIDATTMVAGAGRMETTIRVPLLSPDLSFQYEGKVGPMDARAFNDAFVNLRGIRVESGEIDSLWFDAEVHGGTAKGTFHGIYRDLELEMLDQRTGERGVGDRLKTFVLNDLMLESNNVPGDSSPRTGTIDDEHSPDETFFKFLWHSVRSGMYSLVGM